MKKVRWLLEGTIVVWAILQNEKCLAAGSIFRGSKKCEHYLAPSQDSPQEPRTLNTGSIGAAWLDVWDTGWTYLQKDDTTATRTTEGAPAIQPSPPCTRTPICVHVYACIYTYIYIPVYVHIHIYVQFINIYIYIQIPV